jgi:hypothetical protein
MPLQASRSQGLNQLHLTGLSWSRQLRWLYCCMATGKPVASTRQGMTNPVLQYPEATLFNKVLLSGNGRTSNF